MPVPSPAPPPLSAVDEAWRQALARGVCVHCGGPLGGGWREEDGPFCCRGCRAVHDLIRGAGLDRYYDLRRGERSPAALLRPDDFAWLDRQLAGEPQRDRHAAPLARRPGGPLRGLRLAGRGAVPARGGRSRPAPQPVARPRRPRLGSGATATSSASSRAWRASATASAPRASRPTGRRPRSAAAPGDRGGRGGVNVMMFSIAFYAGSPRPTAAALPLLRLAELRAGDAGRGVSGPVFFRGAWAGLRQRVAHLDLPISIGMLLAWVGLGGGVICAAARRTPTSTPSRFRRADAGRALGAGARPRAQPQLAAGGGRRGGTDGEGAARRAARGRCPPHGRAGDELWIAPGDLVPVAASCCAGTRRWRSTGSPASRPRARFPPGETAPAGAFNAGLPGFAARGEPRTSAASRLHDLLRPRPRRRGTLAPREPLVAPRRRHLRGSRCCVLAGGRVPAVVRPRSAPRARGDDCHAVVTCPCALGLATPLAEELTHHALRRARRVRAARRRSSSGRSRAPRAARQDRHADDGPSGPRRASRRTLRAARRRERARAAADDRAQQPSGQPLRRRRARAPPAACGRGRGRPDGPAARLPEAGAGTGCRRRRVVGSAGRRSRSGRARRAAPGRRAADARRSSRADGRALASSARRGRSRPTRPADRGAAPGRLRHCTCSAATPRPRCERAAAGARPARRARRGRPRPRGQGRARARTRPPRHADGGRRGQRLAQLSPPPGARPRPRSTGRCCRARPTSSSWATASPPSARRCGGPAPAPRGPRQSRDRRRSTTWRAVACASPAWSRRSRRPFFMPASSVAVVTLTPCGCRGGTVVDV